MIINGFSPPLDCNLHESTDGVYVVFYYEKFQTYRKTSLYLFLLTTAPAPAPRTVPGPQRAFNARFPIGCLLGAVVSQAGVKPDGG